MKIPFNKPHCSGRELEYMAQAVRQGHASGDGPFTKQCHDRLEKELGIKKVLLTTSCTHALEMAALLLNIQEGDEVIFPSFTFVSTVNAFVLRGARPVFADIRPDTLNIDEQAIERLITPRTKAIVVVHYAGVGCEMDVVEEVARRHHLDVVEDNAHGLFGKYRGRFLGSMGCLATQSFHETKNITCGEGGALFINDRRFEDRAEIIREKGTDRSRFFRGQVDKYGWVDLGSSYLPSDILAAFLLAQLENARKIQQRRREIWTYYATELRNWADEQRFGLPRVPNHCEQAYHLFYLLTETLDQRQALIAELKRKGIYAVFHYQPLHLSPMGKKFGGKMGDCPVTEQVADRIVRLPFFFDLTSSEMKLIVDSLRSFCPRSVVKAA